MAGTNTITEIAYSGVKRIKFEWLSDASGHVNGTLTTNRYDGALVCCQSEPGVATPTSYTLQIKDEDGNDILAGSGATRSTSAKEYIKAPQGAVSNSKLELVIDSAGNAKNGTVYLWLR